LTWHLPRNHDPLAQDWSGINIYLEHLSGENCHQDVLLCYYNAVLKGRSDLKSFTFDWSSRGGKGTFARLLTDLIGSENIYSGTWKVGAATDLNLKLTRKRLVVFWDEDRQTGNLVVLSLTGSDFLRAEEKGRKLFNIVMTVWCKTYPFYWRFCLQIARRWSHPYHRAIGPAPRLKRGGSR